MNIHHYYSILSLLKFERTTEREKKGKKKKERENRPPLRIFPLVSMEKYPKFKRYTYESCSRREIIHVTNLLSRYATIQFRDTATINYEGGD